MIREFICARIEDKTIFVLCEIKHNISGSWTTAAFKMWLPKNETPTSMTRSMVFSSMRHKTSAFRVAK